MKMSKKLSKLIIVMLLLCNTIAACTPNVNNISGNASENLITPSTTKQVSPSDSIMDDKDASTALPNPSLSSSALASQTPQPTLTPVATPQIITRDITVHFLDVGQADSVFIELPNDETMLIDAGNAADDDYIIKYIKDSGHETLNYLVATHPHEDHIGGMTSVINSFEIGSIYMPKASTNTRTFEDLLLAIQEKGHTINTAKAGVSLIDAGILKVEFIAPNRATYDDLNDYSAVVKITYGTTSFLFMGDAEEQSENEITADINVDVLKVGHHGSSSSTGQAFLDKVTPKYAVISVGADNSYGHPTQETLSKLENAKANILRTDENGAIVITSDGSDISVKASKEKPTPTPAPTPTPTPTSSTSLSNEANEITVYVTRSGSKYHRDGCRYLSNSKISTSLSEAVLSYSPCSVCDPPILETIIDSVNEAEATQEPDTSENDTAELTVYITKTGSKYHRSGCQYLSKSKIPMSLSSAKASGYSACSKCNPPR